MENCRRGGTSRVEIRCKDTPVFHMVRAIVDDGVRLRAITGFTTPKAKSDNYPLLPPLLANWMVIRPQFTFQPWLYDHFPQRSYVSPSREECIGTRGSCISYETF